VSRSARARFERCGQLGWLRSLQDPAGGRCAGGGDRQSTSGVSIGTIRPLIVLRNAWADALVEAQSGRGLETTVKMTSARIDQLKTVHGLTLDRSR
jgi:hypothetical protein